MILPTTLHASVSLFNWILITALSFLVPLTIIFRPFGYSPSHCISSHSRLSSRCSAIGCPSRHRIVRGRCVRLLCLRLRHRCLHQGLLLLLSCRSRRCCCLQICCNNSISKRLCRPLLRGTVERTKDLRPSHRRDEERC